jgi:thiosulfate/3-mercaptopyruvate sulfurtransferase
MARSVHMPIMPEAQWAGAGRPGSIKGFDQVNPLRRSYVVPLPHDPDPKLAAYAHPERLVTTQWLADHLGDEGLVVVESDEDVLLYDSGHIPGAVKVDWHTDLNDPVLRDYVDGKRFAEVLGQRGIGRDTTVVFYGDKNNWWAAYALWVFTLFGHEDVRLLDGGRAKWIAEGREITREVPTRTPVDYPVVERNDPPIRAFKDDVLAHLGSGKLVDVRSPGEFTGELLHMPDYPQEGAMRGGHIPGARSVPWARAAADDATFKTREELEAIYQQEKGLTPQDDVIAYCRIGERSSHTWFVLTHLLGYPKVRNYDGSWTEWGNTVRVPIEAGPER